MSEPSRKNLMAGMVLMLIGGLASAQELIPLPPGDPMAAQSRVERATAVQDNARNQPQRPSWRLGGTWQRGAQQLAVINGETVGIGGRVQGARVDAIAPGQVTLSYQGRAIVLRDRAAGRPDSPILTPHGANP